MTLSIEKLKEEWIQQLIDIAQTPDSIMYESALQQLKADLDKERRANDTCRRSSPDLISLGDRSSGGRHANLVLQQLMAARRDQRPLDLEKVYNGHHLTARVECDGHVTWNGNTYDSLSTAAGAARASIIGAPAGRKYPQTNGWTFWGFRDADGQLKPMDVMRKSLAPGDTPVPSSS